MKFLDLERSVYYAIDIDYNKLDEVADEYLKDKNITIVEFSEIVCSIAFRIVLRKIAYWMIHR